MSRHDARENTFLIVFERAVTCESNPDSLELFKQKSGAYGDYVEQVYNGIAENSELLRFCISRFSAGFKPDRIYKADYSVLLIAIYEILFTDIPFKAAVNEAVELSKKYSTPASAKFINGILASVIDRKEKILSGEEKSDELREIAEAEEAAREAAELEAGDKGE